MRTGLDALDDHDWTQLYHAYGRAEDTPARLQALVEDDQDGRKAALEHLWSAIIHQGTPGTATGPAALVVAGLLGDSRLDSSGPELRAALISFLGAVAGTPGPSPSREELEKTAAGSPRLDELLAAGDDEALYEDEEAGNALYARSLLGCIQVTPALAQAVLPQLGAPDGSVRAAAAAAMVAMRGALSPAQAAEHVTRMESMAAAAGDPDERSAAVLVLGELGGAPVSYLSDPSRAVRLCAALAPALAEHPGATAELVQALEAHAGEIDGWFRVPPPQFDMKPRFSVVRAVLERVHEFDRLGKAAIAVVGITEMYCVDFDWGPLLAAAFSEGNGRITTEAQRGFLRALVDRTILWDPKFGNPDQWFRKAGLPYDRKACAAMIEGG